MKDLSEGTGLAGPVPAGLRLPEGGVREGETGWFPLLALCAVVAKLVDAHA